MDSMRAHARDTEEGRVPLSRTEIDNDPRHPPTEHASQLSTATKDTQVNMEDTNEQEQRTFLAMNPTTVESSSTSGAATGQPRRAPRLRYTFRANYNSGDKVIACVCDQRLGSWRHGVVANLVKHPPRYEGPGQWSFPVLYRSGFKTVMGYFNPSLCEVFYDEWISSGRISL